MKGYAIACLLLVVPAILCAPPTQSGGSNTVTPVDPNALLTELTTLAGKNTVLVQNNVVKNVTSALSALIGPNGSLTSVLSGKFGQALATTLRFLLGSDGPISIFFGKDGLLAKNTNLIGQFVTGLLGPNGIVVDIFSEIGKQIQNRAGLLDGVLGLVSNLLGGLLGGGSSGGLLGLGGGGSTSSGSGGGLGGLLSGLLGGGGSTTSGGGGLLSGLLGPNGLVGGLLKTVSGLLGGLLGGGSGGGGGGGLLGGLLGGGSGGLLNGLLGVVGGLLKAVLGLLGIGGGGGGLLGGLLGGGGKGSTGGTTSGGGLDLNALLQKLGGLGLNLNLGGSVGTGGSNSDLLNLLLSLFAKLGLGGSTSGSGMNTGGMDLDNTLCQNIAGDVHSSINDCYSTVTSTNLLNKLQQEQSSLSCSSSGMVTSGGTENTWIPTLTSDEQNQLATFQICLLFGTGR